jgi:putative methyltransferase
MKKVYFAQINNIIAEAVFLPLSVAYVWEYCRLQPDISKDWVLGSIFFERKTVAEYMELIEDPDVFAFSTYVWNWSLTTKLAREIKKTYPNCLIVFGGPQVPYKKEWLHSNRDICDLVVTYAGEKSFAEILKGNHTYAGIISENGYTPPRPDKEINYIPSPYLSGLMESLMEPGTTYSAIIETNRGCPYSCTFCDQEASYYNKIQLFDRDRVLKEIDWMSDHKIDFMYFADSNLGIFDRDIEFVNRLAENKKRTGYPRNIDYATAKQQPERILELGKILNHKAKISRGVTIALQSMNPKTLAAIKRINIANTDLENTVKTYNKNNIENYCELILGLPEETFESWLTGIGKILELGSNHALTVHPLSVVPNTPFSDPNYIDMYGLKYTPTQAPAGGNMYPKDCTDEIDYICYSSNTMSKDEWVDSYFFAKGVVIPHHYHGVTQMAAEYLNREHNIKLLDFYKLIFDFSKNSDGYLNKEYTLHTESVTNSLFKNKVWGRPLFGGEFHYQDNSATAASLYCDIDVVHDEINKLVRMTYDVDVTSVLKFNKHILNRFTRVNDTEIFDHNWVDYFNGNPLKEKQTEITVIIKQYNDIHDHAKHIFWYGRKSKRCFLNYTGKEL